MVDTKIPNIILYWNIFSQPSRAVKAALLIGKIEHTDRFLDFMTNEHKSDWYLKINPSGLVPAIQEDEDFYLAESSAILKYLATSRDSNLSQYYPDNPKTRALID